MLRPFFLPRLLLIGLAAVSFGVQAQSPLAVGQRLTPSQLQAQAALPTVDIAGKSYRVAQTGRTPVGLPLTLLIRADGVVGQTLHEVVIQGVAPEAARQQAAAALAGASETTPYERLGMTVARYPTLAQAVEAMGQIRQALPAASVNLPITWERMRLM